MPTPWPNWSRTCAKAADSHGPALDCPVAGWAGNLSAVPLDVPGGWPALSTTLLDGRDLTVDEAEHAMSEVLSGNASTAQIAALVIAVQAKGAAVDELTGMVRAMQAAAEPLQLPADTIDIVGMGGAPARRAHALNVSTMASFVAAGAGATVCKHGNRRASSTSGSFDFLEALGVGIELHPRELAAAVAAVGIGFAFARTFHPAMRHAAPVRADLGVPTVFNVLGPLSHPGRVTRQVVGVSDGTLAEPMAQVLRANGAVRVLVVSGHGQLDELSLTGPSMVVEVADDEVRRWELDPAALGLPTAEAEQLRGGDATVNVDIAKRVFGGEPGPYRDIVALNAAAGLMVAGVAADIVDGLERSWAAIDSGAASAKLDALVTWTAAASTAEGSP